jgi:hypothetical protein
MTATAEGLFVRGERGAKAPLYPCSQDTTSILRGYPGFRQQNHQVAIHKAGLCRP